MKVTSVELHTDGSSEVFVLSFRDPTRSNAYNIESMTGLGADNIVSRYYGVSSSGQKFHNLSVEDREIAIKILLNPKFSENKTYSDLRDDLYRAINSSRTGLITIKFKNGSTVVAVVSGQSSKFEPDLFAKDPSVTLTLKSDDPMLKAPNPVVVPIAGAGVALTTIQDDISTAWHGFEFVMNINAELGNLTLTDPDDPGWFFEIGPGGIFVAGDVLHFSSNLNNKKLYVVRAGQTIHLADKIAPGSSWPIIFPRQNKFACNAVGVGTWVSFSYYPTFWGV